MARPQHTQREALDRASAFHEKLKFTPLYTDPVYARQMLDHVNPEHHLRSMIGYHLAWENSLIGMVMVQGKQREVVNIGLGIKQVAVEPRDATVSAYVESLSHKVCVCTPRGHPHPNRVSHKKLTGLEMSFLAPSLGDEVVLRRLCILLALKSAYIKAIGQPIGFDWSRLEFNISEETCSGDGQPLTGWEFRLYKAHLGVQRRGILVEESYQCVTAHFRGTADSKFVWQDNNKDLESWVQFINIDQMTNVIPKLTD
jgi:4'-phosphopantetheinyl transferase